MHLQIQSFLNIEIVQVAGILPDVPFTNMV